MSRDNYTHGLTTSYSCSDRCSGEVQRHLLSLEGRSLAYTLAAAIAVFACLVAWRVIPRRKRLARPTHGDVSPNIIFRTSRKVCDDGVPTRKVPSAWSSPRLPWIPRTCSTLLRRVSSSTCHGSTARGHESRRCASCSCQCILVRHEHW